jgi:iron complex outermembrane receptor protein
MVNTYRLFYQTPSSVSTWNVLQSHTALAGLTAGPKFSSFFVEDASFVKLQNVTIGYTLPANTIPQIRNLRVFLSGNNLYTLTGYDGIDPQVNYLDPGSSDSGGDINQAGNALAPGIERRNGWFTTRTVTLGIQVDF